MFISRKTLAEILERLERLETIVASATGYDKAALVKLDTGEGTTCPANAHGGNNHNWVGWKDGSPGGYCSYCGKRL